MKVSQLKSRQSTEAECWVNGDVYNVQSKYKLLTGLVLLLLHVQPIKF